jgi:hypothetical protein
MLPFGRSCHGRNTLIVSFQAADTTIGCETADKTELFLNTGRPVTEYVKMVMTPYSHKNEQMSWQHEQQSIYETYTPL